MDALLDSKIEFIYPNKKAVAVCGDGGYGLIEWEQMNKLNCNSHVKFENPDFVSYAKSFGAEGNM